MKDFPRKGGANYRVKWTEWSFIFNSARGTNYKKYGIRLVHIERNDQVMIVLRYISTFKQKKKRRFLRGNWYTWCSTQSYLLKNSFIDDHFRADKQNVLIRFQIKCLFHWRQVTLLRIKIVWLFARLTEKMTDSQKKRLPNYFWITYKTLWTILSIGNYHGINFYQWYLGF